MDPSDLWFPNAQTFEDYDDIVEVPASAGQDGKEKMKKSRRKHKAPSSYVITKAPKKGHRLIKIEIFDLNGPQTASASTSSEARVVSAQYIVSEIVDEIMDMSEKLVNKICKKICEDSIDL